MSLDNFIRLADVLIEFESDLKLKQLPIGSVHSLNTHKDEIKGIWKKAKVAYETFLEEYESEKADQSDKEGQEAKETKKVEKKKDSKLESIKAKYKATYSTYCNCQVILGDIQDKLTAKIQASSVVDNGFKLPSCDTPPFYGDYLSWPTFRDNFVAAFVKSNLRPVQKLMHLRQKTRNDAFDIVSEAPLEDCGFDIAWQALKSRYEN